MHPAAAKCLPRAIHPVNRLYPVGSQRGWFLLTV